MECKTSIYNAARNSAGPDPVVELNACAPPAQKATMREIIQATDETLTTIEGVLDGIMGFMFGVPNDEIKENPITDMEDALVRNNVVANRIREKLYVMSDRLGR